MKRNIIIDTGIIVALVNRNEQTHEWVKNNLKSLSLPFFTCESVITESCFLLQDIHGGEDAVLNLISSNKLQISFNLSEEVTAINQLIKQYKSIPMSLADACLVRMSELIRGSSVFTLDSDFRIYRQYKNQVIPVIMPE
ncbi:type II toxin-antitoxin system VapC family toxin [Geminocystis herdmanii]|uniref:type II toxin-antitoxin system VapC family toxin n=1 Tax=Geminocystis herdmanii TaxID=669359 RepID=UPI00034953C3|nr:PIN domain-containing protein [Geminocystis herdmanii]